MRWAGAVGLHLAALALACLTAIVAFPASAATDAGIESAFVVMGPHDTSIARVITTERACPPITIDGASMPMARRAAPGTEPLRKTASASELSKPSAFPVMVCEASLPAGTGSAVVAGRVLPLPRKQAKRIVVIGDTGCRLKAADDAWQACNDPEAYPFAQIAAQAAAWKPDLVIHVGDYLYRENPCPADQSGCAGSPWGYGWDAWKADFFAPGAALLAAAPWVVVRGNHENCNRAGQGWWRFLDPHKLKAGRDCNDPANDVIGDHAPAYAVSLGRRAQVVVLDLSKAGHNPYEPGDPRIAEYGADWKALRDFASKADFTFATDHYPVFGVGAERKDGKTELFMGDEALIDVFAGLDKQVMPRGVDALLAGHIHLWQQIDFGGLQPSQFIAGFSGTQEDTVPLPETLPKGQSPLKGVPVKRFDAIVDKFGWMTLERTGRKSWKATVYGLDGTTLRHCRIHARTSECTPG